MMPPVLRALAADAVHAGRDLVARLGATTAGDKRARAFKQYGPGSVIVFPPGPTYGQHHIAIGSRTLVGPGVSLVVGMSPDEPMQLPDPDGIALRLGDRVNIGRGSSIAARFSIEIGDDVTTGPNVYITDHDHAYDKVDVPIGLQWPVCAAVRIGAGTWLGTGVVVLPGATIGRNVVVAAGSVVRGEVPDHSVFGGVPAKVLRRHTPDGWDPPLPARPPSPPPPADWPHQ